MVCIKNCGSDPKCHLIQGMIASQQPKNIHIPISNQRFCSLYSHILYICVYFLFFRCVICKQMCVEDTQEMQQSCLSFCITSTHLKRAPRRYQESTRHSKLLHSAWSPTLICFTKAPSADLLSPPGHRGRSYRWLPCCFGAKSLCAAQEGISCADTTWCHC